MRILVTNDDGVAAPGIWALARELAKVGDVLVAAPNRDMSGSAAAMALRRPIRVRPAKPPRDLAGLAAYAISSPPAGCVALALRGAVAPGAVDVVVSGINAGANLGRDALLSGTVGAAFIAALEGVPAVAVSVVRDDFFHFEPAARVAARLVQRLGEAAPAGNVLLNVNLPNLPAAQLAGVKLTHLSHDCCLPRLEVRPHDGRAGSFIMTTGRRAPCDRDEGSDEWAVANAYVSVTPLLPDVSFDLSDPRVPAWLADLLPVSVG